VQFENFTWDWIYAGYVEHAPRFARHLDDVRAAFALAEHRLQTDPLCAPWPEANARLAPIARAPRLGREATRTALGLQAHERLVLVTLGGMAARLSFPPSTGELEAVVYAIPGGAEARRRDGQRLLLPYHSDQYHPDLIAASDAVIGKTGYSTVAEAYHAGLPFGYVPRPRFPESPVMAAFIEREMGGVEVQASDFEAGRWANYSAALLRLPRRTAARPNGASQAADYIRGRL
jgi:UDP:flavonoid glycosyltransferase YjiC (YdhE family)